MTDTALCDPKNSPLISVVILSFNRLDILPRNLENTAGFSYQKKEIIVVDNNSLDGTKEYLSELSSKHNGLKIVRLDKNLGVGGGRNAGFQLARGEYVIYLDDDSIAPKDICEKTIYFFENNPSAACASYLLRAMPRGHLLNDYSATIIGNYWGGAHAFRSSAMRKCGYLDERFVFGGEEFDHSLAIYAAGYDVRICRDVVVEHYSRHVSSDQSVDRLANWMSSMSLAYLKWFPYRYSIPLIVRQWLAISYAGVRRGILSPVWLGPYRLVRHIATTPWSRTPLNDLCLSFYLCPDTVPNHCHLPFARLLSKIHAYRCSANTKSTDIMAKTWQKKSETANYQ